MTLYCLRPSMIADYTSYMMKSGQPDKIQWTRNEYLAIQHLILHSDAVGFSIMESDLYPCTLYSNPIFSNQSNQITQTRI
jgi:hypothetical protein